MHVSSFLTSTPDMQYAFYNTPSVLDIARSNPGVSSNHYKYAIYSQFYDFLPRNKKTGFEAYAELDASVRERLSSLVAKPVTKNATINVLSGHNPPTDFVEESIKVARIMSQQANDDGKKIALMYSGGIDSELMCNIFLDAGIEFELYFFDYQTNSYDKEFAVAFCETNGLKLNIIDFDPTAFMTSKEIEEYATYYNESSPQILCYRKMADILTTHGLLPIMAGEFRFVFGQGTVKTKLNWVKGTPSDPNCPVADAGGHWRFYPDCTYQETE